MNKTGTYLTRYVVKTSVKVLIVDIVFIIFSQTPEDQIGSDFSYCIAVVVAVIVRVMSTEPTQCLVFVTNADAIEYVVPPFLPPSFAMSTLFLLPTSISVSAIWFRTVSNNLISSSANPFHFLLFILLRDHCVHIKHIWTYYMCR